MCPSKVRKLNKFLKVSAFFLLTAVLTGAGPYGGNGGPGGLRPGLAGAGGLGGPGGGPGPMQEEVLKCVFESEPPTRSQLNLIKKIKEERESRRDFVEGVRENRQNLERAIKEDAPETEVKKLFSDLIEKEKSLALFRFEGFLSMRKVFTSSQRAKAASCRQALIRSRDRDGR